MHIDSGHRRHCEGAEAVVQEDALAAHSPAAGAEDCLMVKQAQLLASMEYVPNRRAHRISSADAMKLANQGRQARTSMLGSTGGSPSAFHTLTRKLMAAVEEINNIELPLDHPAAKRLAIARNLLKMAAVHQVAYTMSCNKIAATSDVRTSMGSSWPSRTPDRLNSRVIVPAKSAPLA